MRDIVAKRLADDVEYFGHLTTGFLGTPLICQALSENGYPDLAYMLLFNKRYPSWLYPVTMGATTIWERWDGIKPDGTFQTAGMNSFNHYAYGAIGNWLYTGVAGINIDPENPGYKHVIIKPQMTDSLQYAKAGIQSGYGYIESHWKREHDKTILNVVIPANTTATIMLPTNNPANVLESNKPLTKVRNIKILHSKNNNMRISVGSGNYSFEIKQ
jgi:alpha-L-rhamnosidase